MKIEFKFEPGQTVLCANGFTGQIELAAANVDGARMYQVANDYHTQWTREADLRPVAKKSAIGNRKS